MPHVWDRQPDENDTAWTAFKAYRDQALPRQIRLAAVHGRVTLAEAYEISKQHDWKERVAAFDQHHENIFQEEYEATVRASAKERAHAHNTMLRTFRDALLKEIDKWHAVVTDNQTPTVTPAVLGKMTEIVLKLERLVAGEATAQTKQTFDFSKLTPDELLVVQGILQKSGMHVEGLTEDEESPKNLM